MKTAAMIAALLGAVLTLNCVANAGEAKGDALAKAGEGLAEKYRNESSDKSIGNWIGMVQCRTAASDSPEEIVAIEFVNLPRGVCADETFAKIMENNSSSKDYTCGMGEKTFCIEDKGQGIKDFFLKKQLTIPYVHLVDSKKRKVIMMQTSKVREKFGIKKSVEVCQNKARKLSSSTGAKVDCIEPYK